VNWTRRVFKFGRRRAVAICLGPLALALAAAAPASAATTVSVSMTFNEPKEFDLVSGCAVFLAREGLCGSGVAVPYGHATETIVFGGCGFGRVRCDLRTVTVAGGWIFLDEFAGNFTCNNAKAGACEAPLTDVVAGGTGTCGCRGKAHAQGTRGGRAGRARPRRGLKPVEIVEPLLQSRHDASDSRGTRGVLHRVAVDCWAVEAGWEHPSRSNATEACAPSSNERRAY